MVTTALVDVGSGIEKAFYAVFSIYLIGMASLAVRGYLLKRDAKTSGGVEEEMNYHFLAGSSFGPVVLFLNFCAQYIGGIVMVATPDDSRTLGYMMIMWISGCSWCGGTFNVITPRTREVMRGRNYLSPNDYLTDRYRSVWITALGVCCSTFQMIMITGLEWKSLGHVLRAILGQDSDTKTWVWLLGMFIFCCECMGGMASVALTDAIQAGLLLFSFFCMPLFCMHNWGGYYGVGGVSCENREVADGFGDLGGGLNSPFSMFATDACYKNDDTTDVATGCGYGLSLDGGTGMVFPFSFLKFAGGADLPPWQNSNHTFGTKSKYVKPTDKKYHEVCSYKSEQGEMEKICPQKETEYRALSGLLNGFSPGATVHYNHNLVILNCPVVDTIKTCTYGLRLVDVTSKCNTTDAACPTLIEKSRIVNPQECGLPDPNTSISLCNVTDGEEYEKDHIYPGELHFPDGTWGYTPYEHSATQQGCVGINMPNVWHFKYPDKELVALMFSFGFMWIPFALAPVTLHRVMTAKDADSLRFSLCVLHMFPISFFLPVILLGMTASALWPADSTSAFPLVAFHIAMKSGFGAFISTICLVACMASFMSTADSIVICGSLLFTIDMYYNLIKKGKVAMNELMIVTKCMSFFMICCGIIIATESTLDFIEMLWIGNGILGSLVPVYLGMFFPQLRAVEVFFGMVVNIAAVMAFQFVRWWPVVPCLRCGCDPETGGARMYPPPQLDCNPHGGISRSSPALPYPLGNGDADELYLWFLPPFWGTLLGVPLTFVAHYALRDTEWIHKWFDNLQAVDKNVLKKYGSERMDLDREGKIVKGLMAGCVEPMTTPMAWPFLAFPFIAPLAMPWWGYGIEPLAAVGSKGGMPDWCFDFTIVNSFGTASLIVVCACFWKGRPETVNANRKASFGVRKESSTSVIKTSQVMPSALPVATASATVTVGPTKVHKPIEEMQAVVPGQVVDNADLDLAEEMIA